MNKFSLNQPNLLSVRARVVLSAGSQIIGQIIGAALAVLTLKIVSTSLGVANYGVYATALAFVSTFSLLTDLGVSSITGRELAKRPQDADKIMAYNMGLRLALCLLAVPIIIGLSFIFYPGGMSSLKLSIALLSTYLVFDASRSVCMAYFTSLVRNDVAAIVGTTQQLILFLLSILVGAYTHSVNGFISAFIVAQAASAALAVHLVRSRVTITPRVNIRFWRESIGMSLSLGIILIANLLYLKADSILLSIIKGPVEVGLYGIAYALVLTFMTLPDFIMTALIPSMTTAKTRFELSLIVEKAYSYMVIFACLLAVVGYLVSTDIILVVSSKEFMAATTPFAILCFASAFSYLNKVFGYASVSINKHHKLIFVSLGVLILNVALNIVLIPIYSVQGAAWATVACEILSFILVYVIFTKETKVTVRILHSTYKPVLAAIVVLFACMHINFLWDTSSPLLNTVIAGIISLMLYLITLAVLRGVPEEVPTMLKVLRHRLQTRR